MKLTLPLSLLALAMALCGAPSVLHAQTALITPRAQSRSVQIAVTVSDTPKSTSAQASNFGVFNKTLNYTGGAGVDTFQVNAVQNSAINAASITAAGGVIDRLGHLFAADGTANADFVVTFRVGQKVNYSIGGFLLWDEYLPDATSVSPNVKLSGPS